MPDRTIATGAPAEQVGQPGPAQPPWRRLWPAAGFLVIGIVISFTGFTMVRRGEDHRFAADFDRIASGQAQALQSQLDRGVDLLNDVRDFIDANGAVSRAQFHTFAAGDLSRQAGIQALEWVPRVPDDQRAAFEAAIQREGLPNFRIRDRLADGQPAPATARPDHFPVTYIEPLLGNEAALGFDLTDLPSRQEAVERVLASGEPSATGRLVLIQEQHQGYGFLLLVPVYRDGVMPSAVAERRQDISGFALGVFRVPDVVAAALHGSASSSVAMELVDSAAPAASQLLYSSSPAPASSSGMRWSGPLRVTDRQWTLRITPTADFSAERQSSAAMTLLLSGLLATVTVAAYLASAANRSTFVNRLVTERTAQWQRAIAVRQRAEALLQQQVQAAEDARGQTRAILDATSEAILLVSPDSRFLTVNRRFGELFPIPLSAIIGRRFDEIAEHVQRIFADPAAFAARITGTAADHHSHFTLSVHQRWPEARELELFSAPVPAADGTMLGRLYVFRDVTRERAVDRMKSEFVSLVSHELRTPLTSIKGYADLLVDGEVGPLTDDQREFLAIIKSNADRLTTLIGDFLDIARIESGKVELHRTTLDLGVILQDAASSLRPQIGRKGQQLRLDLTPDVPLVSGDANRVMQIVTNLLSNAHKYTPNGGRITLQLRAEGDALRVSVQDTGIGIGESEQRQLFTKFFRGQHRLVQDAGGTGLGLAITRSLVELHGGTLTVQSAPDEGSTFSFTLPAPPPSEPWLDQRGTPPLATARA